MATCQLIWLAWNRLLSSLLVTVYLLITLIITIYAFNRIRIFKPKYASLSGLQLFIAYFRDLFNDRLSSLVTIQIHLITQISHVLVIIIFYQSSQPKYSNDNDCRSLQQSLFIASIVLVLFYKFISFIALCTYGSISNPMQIVKTFLMQLLSFEIIRTIYLRYLFDKRKELYHTTKVLLVLYSLLVSTPMCYIQLIYTWSYGGNSFIHFSTTISIINITLTCLMYDYVAISNALYGNGGFHISIYQRKYKMDKCNGWTLGIRYDLFYIFSVFWRILDITSTIFIYCLVWLSLGWVAFLTIMSVLFIGILFTNYANYESTVCMFVGSVTIEPLSFGQGVSQIIYLILITIFASVPFDCPSCPSFDEREILINDGKLFAVLIYCWIARILSMCAYYGAGAYEEYEEKDESLYVFRSICNWPNISGGDKALEWDLLALEQKCFASKYDYFDTDAKITMLMKAIQSRRILFSHYLMDNMQQIELDAQDTEGRNVLDYLDLAVDRVNDRKYKKLIKVDLEEYVPILWRIHKAKPNLKAKNGRNIFLYACYMGDMVCIKRLIEEKPNVVQSIDNDGANAWTIASMTDQHQIMKYLHDNFGITGKKRVKPLDGDKYKILVLGTSQSGKSTIHAQIQDIYTETLFDNREYGLSHLRQNTVQGMLTLLRKIQEMSDESEEYKHYKTDFEDDEKVYDAVKLVVNYSNESFDDDQMMEHDEIRQLVKAIEALWDMNIVKEVYYDRGRSKNGYQFADQNLDYFFENVQEKFSEEYELTKEDIFKTFVRTTGLIHHEIEHNGIEFRVFDVGGQRNERRKWIHCFDAVDRLLYVVSLSSVFEVLVEDEKVNGMTESIKLWKDIVNGKWFKFTKMYLVFNKDDCYREWLKKQCEDGRSGIVAELLQELLGCKEVMDIGFSYQDYYNSKDTLLSHGYIHDIENEINKEKDGNEDRRYLSKDVMHLIDLYLDVYFEGFYDKSIEYISNAFLKCDKSGLREIGVKTLNALDGVDVKRVFSKLFV